MSWLEKILPSRVLTEKKKDIPEGLWSKCDSCGAVLYRAELERNMQVCPKCDHHHRISARARLDLFVDENSMREIASDLNPVDRLKFRDSKRYKDRIIAAQKTTQEKEAIITVEAKLDGQAVMIACFNFAFMGGSMGATVGEKFVQAANVCLEKHIPLICFSASGGARMQEGLFSLLQMAKTSAVLNKLAQAKLPYISILTDPTMGGVAASLSMLGDVIIAEPKALIGFAGPRVIEQTVRQTLPEGFQRSEFLLEHGHIDMIVDRRQLRERTAGLLKKLTHHVAA